MERVSKMLSYYNFCSRRKAEEYIVNNRVKVNNKLVSLGDKCDYDDVIKVDDVIISNIKQDLVYIALNKPKGFVCTSNDTHNRKEAISLIDKKYGRVYNVGRLDIDTEGLLFITNDGNFCKLITHPSSNIEKTYEVICKGCLDEVSQSTLIKGVKLTDGMTMPSKLKIDYTSKIDSHVFITIHEGRNRQVRRMFEAVNHPVIFLKRVKIGNYELPKNLRKGSYVLLNKNEVESLVKLCEEGLKNNKIPKQKLESKKANHQ